MKMMETQQTQFPNWMRGFLLIACVYNMFWGIFIAWFPESFYHWVTESQNAHPEIIIWQGRAILIIGFIYFAAALHPGRFWYFPLIGAFTKIGGAIWFFVVILEGKIGDQGLFHLIMNDGIWVPFLIIIALRGKAYKANK
ncbi:hypothetical protein ACV07N_11710 [Roseivirga echinicomitans]